MPVGHAFARTLYCRTRSGPTRPGTRRIFRTCRPGPGQAAAGCSTVGPNVVPPETGAPIGAAAGRRAAAPIGAPRPGPRRRLRSGPLDEMDGALLGTLTGHG